MEEKGKQKIRIGSRDSKLAVIQANMIKEAIEKNNPEMEVEIITMKTTGDLILNKNLDQVGGKGLFVKELDQALLENRVDITVHSLKDMPMEQQEQLPILGYSKREDPRDAIIIRQESTQDWQGDWKKITGVMGSSSRRRTLQLQKLLPQCDFQGIRGNVQTRLRKLEESYEATVLAVAGLKRLGMEERIGRILSVEEVLPAAGQGILAIQGRKGEDIGYLQNVFCEESRIVATAERSFVRCLDGGCSSPVAAYGTLHKNHLRLRGLYYDEVTGNYSIDEITGLKEEAEELGKRLANQMREAWKMCKGKVWLVGAGPGDAGLMTIKGMQVLQDADVIVYDALVSTEILSMLPIHTEKINVGKRADHHIASQSTINELLLQLAQQGKKVARLKGGDPFVFGRGGEELELLAMEGIPFEVVPGITSAVAVPAYAGIPVTHRDYTSSFHIITGHSERPIDFISLVHMDATLVFLMGIGNLAMICGGLLQAGMKKDMPAAVLEKGTHAAQRKVVSTVERLCEDVGKAEIGTPAIILVGKVCALSEQFSWAEKRILGGRQFIVTRPQRRSSSLTKSLRQLGAQVIEMPGIQTVPNKEKEMLEILGKIGTEGYEEEWMVFTSPVGVTALWERMRQERFDICSLFATGTTLCFAAIGSATAGELEKVGVIPDVVPETYDAENLGKTIAARTGSNARATIFRARQGSEQLIPPMEKVGMVCRDVAVYDTEQVQNAVVTEQVIRLLHAGEINGVTFTSVSTVKSFVHAVGEQIPMDAIHAICIGTQTAAEAQKYKMKISVAKQASIESMLDCITEQFASK